MKSNELKKCFLCEKGMLHNNDVTFLRINIEYLLINLSAVRRQAGLELQLGGPLAQVMGPNEDIASVVNKKTHLICLQCAIRPLTDFTLFQLLEPEVEDGK